ncbi:hypothetical protein AB1N83_011322 [Pleurotus pulmonarius]
MRQGHLCPQTCRTTVDKSSILKILCAPRTTELPYISATRRLPCPRAKSVLGRTTWRIMTRILQTSLNAHHCVYHTTTVSSIAPTGSYLPKDAGGPPTPISAATKLSTFLFSVACETLDETFQHHGCRVRGNTLSIECCIPASRFAMRSANGSPQFLAARGDMLRTTHTAELDMLDTDESVRRRRLLSRCLLHQIEDTGIDLRTSAPPLVEMYHHRLPRLSFYSTLR